MTASPWAPSNAGGAVAPAPHDTHRTEHPAARRTRRPPRRRHHRRPICRRRRHPGEPGRVCGRSSRHSACLVVAAIAITAVITAAIVKTSPRPAAAPTVPAGAAVQCRRTGFGQAERVPRPSTQANAEARPRVVISGDLKRRNGAQNGQCPCGRSRGHCRRRHRRTWAEAARKYLSTSTDLTTAALANKPVDKLVDLTKTNNSAMDSFAEVCGLPH